MTSLRPHQQVPPPRRSSAVAAKVFLGLAAVVIVFQLALAAGAPWGHLTMGGVYPGQLPAALRAAALFQAALLAFFGVVIAVRARLVQPRWYNVSRYLVWLVIAYTVVGAVLNTITSSSWERILWLPVVLALGACAIIVVRTA